MKLRRFLIFLLIFSLVFSTSLIAQKQKKVKVVNWRKLAKFLTKIKGWKTEGKAEGQTMTMGEYSVSQAEREYTSGKKSLQIMIADGAYNPMVYSSYQAISNFEIDTSEQYIKKVTIKGFPGVEKYTYDEKEAELWIVVSNRFAVTLKGENFKSTAGLKKIANKLPLKKIAALAK